MSAPGPWLPAYERRQGIQFHGAIELRERLVQPAGSEQADQPVQLVDPRADAGASAIALRKRPSPAVQSRSIQIAAAATAAWASP